MRKITICLLMIFLANICFGAIPVVDVTAIARETFYFLEEVKKWTDYIKDFDDLGRKFQFRYINFLRSVEGLDIWELELLLKNAFDTVLITNRPYWGDILKLDTWNSLWKKIQSIISCYPALKEESYIKENRYYRLNKSWREFQDKNLEREKEYLKDLQENVNLIADMRWLDTVRKGRFDTFSDLLSRYSRKMKDDDPEQTAAAVGKIRAVMAEMMYERLILNMQLNAIVRVFFERELKREVMSLDHQKRRALLNKNAGKNLELVKEIIRK